jgi:hypothetical protein
MFKSHLFHLVNVFLIFVIEVISNIACVSVDNGSWDLYEVIPNADSLAVYVIGSFNLVRSSGNSPSEVIGVNVESACDKVVSAYRELG